MNFSSTLKRIYRHLLSAALLLAATACRSSDPGADGVFRVVATTSILADAVRQVAGPGVEVTALMPPGVDPHLYKASVRDIKRIMAADVVFYGGLHLEGKMQEVLRKSGRLRPAVDASDGIPRGRLKRLGGTDGLHDPHVWFDASLWSLCVQHISSSLQRADPGRAAAYRQNTRRYLHRLDSLHRLVGRELARVPAARRVLVTAHDAFGYYGRAYGIEVRGLQGISTLSEYGLRDVTDLVAFLSERRIPAIFAETSVSRNAIEAVMAGCRARGHVLRLGGDLYSDALGAAGSGADTYEKMLSHNTTTIVAALAATPSAPALP